jgi:hypothetical protein
VAVTKMKRRVLSILLNIKFFVDKISRFAQPLTNSAGKLKQEKTQ